MITLDRGCSYKHIDVMYSRHKSCSISVVIVGTQTGSTDSTSCIVLCLCTNNCPPLRHGMFNDYVSV